MDGKLPTAFITHSDCLLHEMGVYHPESPGRLQAIEERLNSTALMDQLLRLDAPIVSRDLLVAVHGEAHVALIESLQPKTGYAYIDADTIMNPNTLTAAYRAAGAAVLATDLVMQQKANNVFCAVRPPGHHAMRHKAMGFCFFNNVAVAANYVLNTYGVKRIAIVDFDVHHGNGTEDIFYDEPRVLLCSTFQHPFYPYSGDRANRENILNIPLPANTKSESFRITVVNKIIPTLEKFEPEFIFISAGFDGHLEDHMANFNLIDDDFRWITKQITHLASVYCPGRIVSLLEGGYSLNALGRCVELHVRELASDNLIRK